MNRKKEKALRFTLPSPSKKNKDVDKKVDLKNKKEVRYNNNLKFYGKKNSDN